MKVAFLDRDGVINKKADEHQYITSKKDFVFNEGIFEVCSLLQAAGYHLVVITNQRGIARGLYTKEDLALIHEYMRDEFKKQDITIADVLYCPHGYDECDCRKPKNGMLRMVTERYPVDLARSILISDSQEDVEMGKHFGVGKNIFVTSDHPEEALASVASQ